MDTNNKLGVGVIGCGAIAEIVHLPVYKEMPQTDLKAVCDTDKDRAEEIADKFDAESWYTNYKDLLERDDIDAVSICTPNSFHREHSVAAANAGKHILLEKPMAPTLEDCDKIIEASQRAGVKLMIGVNSRFLSSARRVKKLLENDTIGKISQVRYHGGHSGPYSTWVAVSDWFKKKSEVGGGVLIDIGAHYLDLMRWFVGDISEVSAIGGNLSGKFEGEDNAIVILTFKNGVMGELDTSWTYNDWYETAEIHGAEGTIFIRDASGPIVVYSDRKIPENLRGPVSLRESVPIEEQMKPTRVKVEHFVESILQDKQPMVTGEDGRAVVEAILAAYRSMETGEKVSLPLEE